MIGRGPILHPRVFELLHETAAAEGIPFTVESHVGRGTFTDADAIHRSRAGVPCGLVSIPLRYMHTPVELIAIKDVQRVGRLLAEFIAGLEPDFMTTIRWEDNDAASDVHSRWPSHSFRLAVHALAVGLCK